MEALLTGSERVVAELEKSTPDRLVTQHNQVVSLQGQIDLIRSCQEDQGRQIHFAMAREAEEADSRVNERFHFVCFTPLYYYFVFWFNLFCIS